MPLKALFLVSTGCVCFRVLYVTSVRPGCVTVGSALLHTPVHVHSWTLPATSVNGMLQIKVNSLK